MADAANLLALLALHLVLTALPLAAAMLAAACCGVGRPSLLLCIGLVASGLVALTSFWAFWASHTVGMTYAYLVPFGSLLLIVACLRSGRLERALLRELATPLALWALGSVFLAYLGFLHGGSDDPLNMAALRFSGGQLPPDNLIPGFFADWFYLHSHHGTPALFPGDWLFSDRPPLQVGYLLAEHGFGWSGNGMREQVIGVIVQQLWIVGLWALLLAARIRRRARALIVVALMFSDLVVVHGFYVWPKLLPAAFLLAAAALFLGPGWAELRRDRRAGLLLGALVALALLGHGASVFGLVPLAVFALAAGLPDRRWLGAALVVALGLLLPWTAYQHFADPPGNRLAKWMLAGVEPIDERGTLETIADSYREAGLGGALENKWHNVGTITGDAPAWERFENAVDDLGGGDWEGAAVELRWLFFFSLVPSLGLLGLGPVAMALARLRGRRGDGPEWRLAVLCWWAVLGGCLAWALLMFGTSQASTSIHVGTLAIPLLALAACVLGLCAVLPRLAPWWVGLSALLTLVIYTPSLNPPEGSAYSPWAAAAALLALAGFVAVAFLGPGGSAEVDVDAP
ncbi:MAG TPA: hypothetical protein VFK14_11940 [Solirubrobacterales bacterium]|nr:hypothetical protein [Solirubrobacterales bacterium]